MPDAQPSDPFTPMAEMAAQVHEVFTAYCAAGFTADQALVLTNTFLTIVLAKSSGA